MSTCHMVMCRYKSALVLHPNNTSSIINMEQTTIRELNEKFKIYFPYEEISIYLQKSKLSDSPLPAFGDLHLMPSDFCPNKLSFRSCYAKEGFSPDKTTPIIEFKRKHPEVIIESLKLYMKKTFSPNMNGLSILILGY